MSEVHDGSRENGKIPFLDMLLVRTDGGLSSTWYCKPTGKGPCDELPHVSPDSILEVSCEWLCAPHISSVQFMGPIFTRAWKKAKSIMEKNQYPPQMFNPVIDYTIEKLVSATKVVTGANRTR